MYRKLYSKIAYVIYRIMFNLKIKDPSYAYILVNKEFTHHFHHLNLKCQMVFLGI